MFILFTTTALVIGTVPGIQEFKVLWRMGDIQEAEGQLVRMVINPAYKCVI